MFFGGRRVLILDRNYSLVSEFFIRTYFKAPFQAVPGQCDTVVNYVQQFQQAGYLIKVARNFQTYPEYTSWRKKSKSYCVRYNQQSAELNKFQVHQSACTFSFLCFTDLACIATNGLAASQWSQLLQRLQQQNVKNTDLKTVFISDFFMYFKICFDSSDLVNC